VPIGKPLMETEIRLTNDDEDPEIFIGKCHCSEHDLIFVNIYILQAAPPEFALWTKQKLLILSPTGVTLVMSDCWTPTGKFMWLGASRLSK